MTDNCKGCKKPIIWGITSEGKRIPLDPRPPVYSVIAVEYPKNGGKLVRIKRSPTLMDKTGLETHIREYGVPVGPWLMAAYVSHFATCSDANRFSANRKS